MNTREAGVLLHISSLPNSPYIGDLGKEAYLFIDFLKESGLKYWQILPTGLVGPGNSPYQSISAFAGNPLFINLEKLKDYGLLEKSDIKKVRNTSKTNYQKAEKLKCKILRKAFENFKSLEEIKKWECYGFCDSQSFWIDDYALFKALKTHFNHVSFNNWPEKLKNYEYEEVEKYRAMLGDEVYFNKFVQYLYFRQMGELKNYATQNGIKLIGDIPIFVSYDSADVWSKSYLFQLNENKEKTSVAGVPPDYFSKTGQLWGNPLYNWEAMKSDDYLWWRMRIEILLKQTDLIRLDHFRGFEAYWEIPANEKTAINGKWTKGPSFHFFDTLKKYFGELPIIAEDLGEITQEVENLRDTYRFPGMKILQFAFGDTPKNPFLLHNHDYNFVVYTGTHDNSTTKSWLEKIRKEAPKTFKELQSYILFHEKHPVWSIIDAAFSSVAKLSIIPMQDFLELDDNARMNIPGTTENNWIWRMKTIPHKKLSQRIKKSLIKYNRFS